MKPVSFCEIVVDYGEYLYRKGSNLILTSAVFLTESCHCTLGLRVISSVYYRFAAVFRNGCLRPLAWCRNCGRILMRLSRGESSVDSSECSVLIFDDA